MLRIRIRIKVEKLDTDTDSDRHQNGKLVPDPHQSENVEALVGLSGVLEGPIWKVMSGRIRIRIKLKGRIRIQTRAKDRIRQDRIRIKVMRIRNTETRSRLFIMRLPKSYKFPSNTCLQLAPMLLGAGFSPQKRLLG